MNYHFLNQLNTEVPQLKNKYYKLLYIYESKLGNTLARYSEENAIPYLNINLILSKKLQHVQANRRPYRAADYLKELLLETEQDIICIDYYELLFEPSLNLNPFELFNSISRNKTLLITWRGDIKDGYFIHAVPGHPEYIKTPIKDMVLIH